MSTENLFSAPMPSAEMVHRMFNPREAHKILKGQTPEETEWFKEKLKKIEEEIEHV